MARSPRWAPIASPLERGASLGALLAGLLLLGAAACERDERPVEVDVLVRLDRVVIDDHDSPVIVLEEEGGPRWLPIWIGPAEAHSIALQIEQRRLPRPNTHDLARSVIHHLKGRVASVVVTELRAGTYYALLRLDVAGEPVEVDARPSDAIAIALRDDAPIFVRESLFHHADASTESAPDEPEPAPKRSI
jgi:bifunctional DNase/RNase